MKTNWLLRCFLLVAVLAIERSTQAAEPYIPRRDDEVLETLPKSLISDELTILRRQLAQAPENLDLATTVSGRYISMGNLEGDPRFYGYARAALKPWWDEDSPPSEVLRLRAKLREKEHLYDTALEDLRKILKQDPRNSQAWIEVTNILRVQGKYEEAWKACDELNRFGGEIPKTICQAPLQAVTGKAIAARTSLERILPVVETQFPSVVPWVLTMQSKIAYALGENEETERYFQDGLAESPQDKNLVRDFADFLLDKNRNAEALSLTREHTNDNGVLLRAAIAAKRVGERELARQWATQLATRFEEIRLRGGQPHGRFEARYELEINDDPQRALAIALTNWGKQKEARDTRNVLEAALGTGNRDAAKPVVAFLKTHGTEDVILQSLVQKLELE